MDSHSSHSSHSPHRLPVVREGLHRVVDAEARRGGGGEQMAAVGGPLGRHGGAPYRPHLSASAAHLLVVKNYVT